jgi:hypothetical protein
LAGRLPASALALLGLAWVAASRATAQERPWVRATGHAVPVWTAADPVPGGSSLSEARLVQPAFVLEAGAWTYLRFLGTLNLEGATMENGELTPGAWGEGFMDRRHPHTYAHELLLILQDRSARFSLTAGKGFAPFGTDDPMMRPALRYPVNHHLAQILERAVVIAAARAGPIILEAGLFNGDEPEHPDQWPLLERFGDSWSGRLTGVPRPGVELQASYAHVHSPEHRPGEGPDQSKWSLSALWNRPIESQPVYGLLEWARTSEADGFFVFDSFLAEGAWTPGRHRLYYRFERTERPEEERISQFRSRRPHLENSILGTTRWSIHTLGYDVGLGWPPGVRLRPLVEVSLGAVSKVGGGLFDVEGLYGQSDFWALSLGLRIDAGAPMPRMGRYGAARGLAAEHMH